MSFTRINANISALASFNELIRVNRSVSQHLLRLSSGKRINSVGDDPAGFSLARSIESRRRSLSQALDNVGTAKNVLSIAEGSYLAIASILQIIKEKTVQAADDSYNSDQKEAIQGQIDALVAEIDEIIDETEFQGTKLIDGSFTNAVFQTGASAGDIFGVNLTNADSANLLVNNLEVSDAFAASAAMAAVDNAINVLNQAAQGVGEYMIRLDNKEDTLGVAVTNIEATRSRVEDADFAEEQMNLIRSQIVQQTAFASFGQANAAPQLVLSLFG
ncbi:MAG: flagellin [Fidelibacterota bacterium]|nr:MAG: flagellin [Candidatus Neomarinimicrobiota bacterium]